MEGKPHVLVLGATGFVGRNLVAHLVQNNLANVTAVDKVLPNCSYLSPEEETLFEKANFLQKNLVNPGEYRRLNSNLSSSIIILSKLMFLFSPSLSCHCFYLERDWY